MGKQYDEIDAKLRTWIEAQHVFFVATAPLAAEGHVNLSPRGLRDTFRVLDGHRIAWVDLTGSGAETIAHLRENGRIVVMLCAFDGPPKVVRLHGEGRVVLPDSQEYADLIGRFGGEPAGTRAIIVVDVSRISDSCGFAVPRLEFVDERDLLQRSAAKKGPQRLATYRAEKNATSIDGLPAIDP